MALFVYFRPDGIGFNDWHCLCRMAVFVLFGTYPDVIFESWKQRFNHTGNCYPIYLSELHVSLRGRGGKILFPPFLNLAASLIVLVAAHWDIFLISIRKKCVENVEDILWGYWVSQGGAVFDGFLWMLASLFMNSSFMLSKAVFTRITVGASHPPIW